jgi:hypothetical protein
MRQEKNRSILRSLVQKAIRRGCGDIAQRAFVKLNGMGDGAWLMTRIGVIAFEECWGSAVVLNGERDFLWLIEFLSNVEKQKDAAGLGSLAYGLVEGDFSALDFAINPLAVKIVAAGIRRPVDFFFLGKK